MRISNRNAVSKLVRPAMFAALVLVAVAGRASAAVPEIDPSSMGSAVALLVAGGSLLLGRRRSK